MSATACPVCARTQLADDPAPHPYMTASPACWSAFERLLGAQYGDPARMGFHQLVVDAYAAQHPGDTDPRAIRSVGIHLMTLALFLDYGVDPALGTRLHRQMVQRPAFGWLERPKAPSDNLLAVDHVPLDGPVGLARERATAWARTVWAWWSPQHEVVEGWLRTSGLLGTASRAG